MVSVCLTYAYIYIGMWWNALYVLYIVVLLGVLFAWFKSIEFESVKMIVLPRVRDAIVYVIPRKLSYKGNKCTWLGMVLWDANVYVILRELFCKGQSVYGIRLSVA
jgi:hypothetical protein